MKTTSNYKLKKPDLTDVVNIEDLNYNADILDLKLKEIENKANDIKVPVTSVNSKTGVVNLSASDIKTSSGQSIELHLSDIEKIKATKTEVQNAQSTANTANSKATTAQNAADSAYNLAKEKQDKKIKDDNTSKKYELGIKNGLLYYREVL